MSAFRIAWLIALAALAGCVERSRVLWGDDDGGAIASDASVAARDAGDADAGGAIGGVVDLTAGGAHSCALVGGALACWGDGSAGALGIGVAGDRLAPARVGAETDWTAITAGQDFTCGLRAAGELWCWGANEAGQLGAGDLDARREPARVAMPAPPTLVRTSRRTACAILGDGKLLCWGENEEGQLGLGDPFPDADGVAPAPVATEVRFADVSPGQGHACAIALDGSLWCWGRNSDGQLGLGPGAPEQVRVPARVGDASDWTRVASGQSHSCGIRSGGTLWCWGSDFAGQMGISRGARFDVPTRVGDDATWAQVSTYVFHTCGVRDDGTLWCWGRNVEGQLGVGDVADRDRPTQIGDRRDWARVAAGWFHTCAQDRGGAVWCTGENGDGRLGVGDPERRNAFTAAVGFGLE